MQHWSPGCFLEGEGKNHSKAVVSCAGVEAWAAAGHNRKVQHMSSPRRSVAEAKPLAMQISWHRSYISLETQEHSWEQQWHLDHTSVGQALLFLCIPHHASADTTISLPGRTYDYPLNNLKQRDETSRPHCQIKQRAPRGLQVWNIGTALYGEGVTSLRPWFGRWLSKLSSSWDIPK